ncbi:MAG: DNA polymerase III subunit chi [Sulfuricaulis sp.]|uniref:DNA polymerase III subunit chi n=1 Tax=Sulfuricaulis sp. TaxID=2003553 RepID=UPI0025DB1AA5|nr:DNA polymerase III subunit chi [Sulfuricaulis sp.]MCR4347478.1 DNA polymerase III subunit chi [Sulfuricaulis sp.]
MTRVDFYLLNHAADGSQDAAVCKLAHKAFRLGHRIYILTPDSSHAQRLDRMMWIFSPGSFIPHGLSSNTTDADMPVLIGYDEPAASHEDVLIQLTPQVPECFSRFQRVAEVVSGADADKAQARERFRFYRDRGYTLQTHNISAGDFVEA